MYRIEVKEDGVWVPYAERATLDLAVGRCGILVKGGKEVRLDGEIFELPVIDDEGYVPPFWCKICTKRGCRGECVL